MDRNNHFLRFLLILALTSLSACQLFDSEDETLVDYVPSFEEIVGEYYFIPKTHNMDIYNDFLYLNLKKGDSLLLRISRDSTFWFNKFYYNQAEMKENIRGKIYFNNHMWYFPLDTSEIKIQILLNLGFKKSSTNNLYFYNLIADKNDFTEFNYGIYYRKMN